MGSSTLRAMVAFSCCFLVFGTANMNGDYLLSQTPHGNATQAKFPTHFENYPGGVESFDIYSPEISTLYSQVFWKGLDPVPLPDDVVKRFAGKGMAVVGSAASPPRSRLSHSYGPAHSPIFPQDLSSTKFAALH